VCGVFGGQKQCKCGELDIWTEGMKAEKRILLQKDNGPLDYMEGVLVP
jgi:hypothetical protein